MRSASATVSSQDFGGIANLTAKMHMGNLDLIAEAYDPVTQTYVPPPSCAAPGSATFVQIPVDRDCNGIADSWEKPFANALGLGDNFPNPSLDNERNNQGDGFSVHDEYRGFHMIDPNTNTVKWASADPTKQDLFYWDPNGIAVTQTDNGRAIDAVFGRNTQGFIALHQVARQDANAINADRPSLGVRTLNFNSSVGTTKGFALVYVKSPLAGGELGRSGPNDDPRSFRNDGVAITIDVDKINSFAASVSGADGMLPSSTLLAQVIAHETGHKLNRPHTIRPADSVPFDPNALPTITLGTFMQDSSRLSRLYTRYLVYRFNGIRKGEQILASPYNLKVSNSDETPIPSPAAPPDWIYRTDANKLNRAAPIPVLNHILIQNQDGTLMNWTPKLSQLRTLDWNFAAADLNGLCLKSTGCQ